MFDAETANADQCMLFIDKTLARLVAIIRHYKREGLRRNETDYWFPIVKPSSKYARLLKDGITKIEQITFSRALGLSPIDTFEVLKKVQRRWRKPGRFSFSLVTYMDQGIEWVLLDEDSAENILPRDQVRNKDFPNWVVNWLAREDRENNIGDTLAVRTPTQIATENLARQRRLRKRARDERRLEVEANKRRKENERRNTINDLASRAGLVNKDMMHVICGREYTLPSHYSPILLKKLKLYESFNMQTEYESNRVLQLEHKIKELERTICEKDEIIGKMEMKLSRNYNVGDILNKIQQCPNSPLAQRLYVLAWAQNPKSSADAIAMSIPTIVAAFLADLGIVDSEETAIKIIKATPCSTTLQNMLATQRELVNKFIAGLVERGTKLCIAHDKGERCGLGRLVRELKYWCDESLRVISIRVDADGTNSDDTTVAEAIDHTLSVIEKHIVGDTLIKLIGAITDTGGGGTTESNAEELKKLNRCMKNFLVANCTFHAHSKCLQNAFEGSFGGGGLGLNTSLQFIHTVYSLQECFGEDLKYQWRKVTGKDPPLTKMPKPVLTRWGYVGRAARKLVEHWDEWIMMMKHGYEKYTTKESTIGRNALKQLHDKDGKENLKLKFEVLFLVAFCDAYWDPHFAWLHRTDDKTKLSGHSSHEVPLRVFIMKTELANLTTSWKEMPEFKCATDTLLSMPCDTFDSNGDVCIAGKDTTEKQVKDFFDSYKGTFNKHFLRWQQQLLPLVIASSDRRAVQIFAKWYLEINDNPIEENEKSVSDDVHAIEFSYKQWLEYLERFCVRKLWLKDDHYDALTSIADGTYLWDDTDDGQEQSNIISKFADFCRTHLFIVPHHSQSTEAGVQETSICGSNQKGETDGSNLVVIRSFDCSIINQRTAIAHETKIKKSNQHMGKGVGSERQLLSQNANANHQYRTSKKTSGRTRAPSGKIKMRETMKRAFEIKFSAEEIKKVKQLLRNKSNAVHNDLEDDVTYLRTGKELRLKQKREKVEIATEKWEKRKENGAAKLKNGDNVTGIAGMTLPLNYTNRFKISSLRLTSQRKSDTRCRNIRHNTRWYQCIKKTTYSISGTRKEHSPHAPR